MEPVLCHGDSLLIQPGNRNIRIGDVIIFKSFGRQCAHRAVGITSLQGQKVYLTKGDNAFRFDDPVSSIHVLGKVLEAKGENGTVYLDSVSWRFRSLFIALYSYVEGRRHEADTVLYRLIDHCISWCHRLAPLRQYHRRDLYGRITHRGMNSISLSNIEGDTINENKQT